MNICNTSTEQQNEINGFSQDLSLIIKTINYVNRAVFECNYSDQSQQEQKVR